MIRTQNNLIVLFVLVFCFAGLQQIHGQGNITKLSQVKTIFIAPIDEPVKREDFSELLKAELRRVGFGITEDEEKADAILALKDFYIEITLHGGRDDVPKLFYGFVLTSKTGAVIWKKKVKFLERNAAENDKIASQKIVDELYTDRRKVLGKQK